MTTHPRVRLVLVTGFVAVVVTGCGSMSRLHELITPHPTIAERPTDTPWLLIENPRFGDVASEPEYVWVQEDKVPTTIKSLVFGKSILLAPPDKVAKYGAPPSGGRVSPRQGGAIKMETPAPAAATGPSGARPNAGVGIGSPPATRGSVVFVDPGRVVIDLAAPDGVKVGTKVSVRRDKMAVIHPVTGELLGELYEEVATGQVVEVRDKYSLVDVQQIAAGTQVQIKDRVVLR